MHVAVLRPEPGNAATSRRLSAAGLTAIRCPLFAVVPIKATLPALKGFDAVLLTSANAVDCGGDAITAIGTRPIIAIGTATAKAARAAGLNVAVTGNGDIVEAVVRARAAGLPRLLHLAGREHRAHADVAATVIVYASDTIPVDPDVLASIAGGCALLHSPRAAERFAHVVDAAGVVRAQIALAAMSEAVARAAGSGWRLVGVADQLNDAAMVALAARIARSLGR
ncbi:Uroporphyrinogen-III synthase (fragment) [Sphingomonas sp. EC-HK361]|uniref:uroporphyrinogen-III synthase n=1 Tax=Sphingomonas sp. EC-HK361 TaxID=2038397 RepID=UPI0012543D0F